MRIRQLVIPFSVLPILLGAAHDSSAMGGIEGTFEYALDAPWRIEPVIDASGHATYGAVPIQLTILDENVIHYDADALQIGNFCELVVGHNNVRRHFGFRDLVEVEMTGSAATNEKTGSWIRGNPPPPHAMCLPGSQSCAAFQSPHGTSEWHTMLWYTPDVAAFTPGADLVLTLTARFTRTPQIACTSTKTTDFLSMKNYVAVHAGEAPLPRFHDNRWAYGDLHFHGQGTDNEGESGYNYRGIIRAMGAMGLDFVLATEHASDSDQILDVDYNAGSITSSPGLLSGDLVSRAGRVLRDMDAQRFAFLHGQLWAKEGANKVAAIEGRSSSGAPSRPQNVLGHGAAPQVFLGGEVDAMPELAPNFPANGAFVFGNGVTYQLSNLCGGWKNGLTTCDQSDTVKQREGVTILQDVQGFNAIHPARVHLVYMPRDPTDTNAFVSSRTGILGGAGRQLTRGDGVLPEMENGNPQKGYAFLAHPVPTGNCSGGTPGMSGGVGPDVVPYPRMMLDQAFRSKAVLGLELWNEDIRMKNAAGKGDTKEIGFESFGFIGGGGFGMRNGLPKGFVTGVFEMYPWARFAEPSYAESCTGMEWTLHHGLKEWDEMLIRGIIPTQTASLSWLPAGEPRRLFMAGGSDAHGDLNYHRAGYMLGLDQTDDMAIGKPRNLVLAGVPETVLPPTVLAPTLGVSVPAIRAHSQTQVLNALQNGAFSVTDGPALRIAIDKNGNGVIDDGDIPMGGIVEIYGDKTLPLLVEWDSTSEWGPIQQVELVIGAIKATEPSYSATFAPIANGPRSAGTPPYGVTRTRAAGGGRKIIEHADGYSEDPTGGMMRFFPLSLSGHRRIDLPLSSLSIGDKGDDKGIVPDRLYIRAFARSQPMVGTTGRCAVDRKGDKCFLRYAFSNPLWSISPPFAAGTCPKDKPRAIDSDTDGMPDGCDPCPRSKQPMCDGMRPPIGGGVVR